MREDERENNLYEKVLILISQKEKNIQSLENTHRFLWKEHDSLKPNLVDIRKAQRELLEKLEENIYLYQMKHDKMVMQNTFKSLYNQLRTDEKVKNHFLKQSLNFVDET